MEKIKENTIYNCDCMEVMKAMQEQGIVADWCITDPPYGIGIDGQKLSICKNPKHNRKQHDSKNWDYDIPQKKYFDKLFAISKQQVLCGANYFNQYIPQGKKGWIIWDKGQRDLTMSDCEIIFTSKDCPTRIVTINRVELLKDGTIHPTQKPLKLWYWILNNYTKEGDLIFDPFAGSCSLAIACHKLKRRYICCEKDKEYYDKGCAWLEQVKSQISMFD